MGLVAVNRLADAAPSNGGVSPAFIPARNPWLLSIAANHAAVEWPGAALDLWIGATLDDAVGFADCRAPFLDACAAMLSRALGDHVRIVAPLVGMKKRELVAQASQDQELLDALDLSWSCYRGTACGECAPCKLRDDAFRANGLASLGRQTRGAMYGGDSHREAR
jgi:7-cyano-7-deazaguanine synthase